MESLRDGDPSRVGPYQLEARLGAGGMGQVFLGRSPGGRLVAVKVVRPELADDASFRRRFADEVKAAGVVSGFYTAEVVASDTDAERPWLATAYIPGLSLHEAVTTHGPLPAASVAMLGAGLAEGLTAVHGEGLVHRDLKPANVILAADGPRLIDFGIARALDATSYTQTGTILGTAAFMSPEQVVGDDVDPSCDVFSLGCVLGFAATGQSPFGTGPPHALTYRVVHAESDLSGVPAPLVDLVGRCLAKDPRLRPGLEVVLRELTGLVPPGWGRDGSTWLPGAITEVIVQQRTRVLTTLTAAEPVVTPPRKRAAPQVEGQVAAVFEVTTSAMRGTKRLSELSWVVLAPLGLFAALALFGVVAGPEHDVELAFAFAWDVVASPSALWIWLLPMGAAVFRAVFGSGSDGHDLITVDARGVTVVDQVKRWRDRTFFLSWDRLSHVGVIAEPSGSSHSVVVRFEDDARPQKDWGKAHSVFEGKYGFVVAQIPVRDAERAAMIPRLRTALAHFGGESYTEEMPLEEQNEK